MLLTAFLYSYIHTQRVTLRVSKKATREFSFDMLAVLSKVKALPEEGFEWEFVWDKILDSIYLCMRRLETRTVTRSRGRASEVLGRNLAAQPAPSLTGRQSSPTFRLDERWGGADLILPKWPRWWCSGQTSEKALWEIKSCIPDGHFPPILSLLFHGQPSSVIQHHESLSPRRGGEWISVAGTLKGGSSYTFDKISNSLIKRRKFMNNAFPLKHNWIAVVSACPREIICSRGGRWDGRGRPLQKVRGAGKNSVSIASVVRDRPDRFRVV